MNWGSAAEFFAMGGYGLYVWGSFGVTAICIAIEICAQLRRARQSESASGRAAKEFTESGA